MLPASLGRSCRPPLDSNHGTRELSEGGSGGAGGQEEEHSFAIANVGQKERKREEDVREDREDLARALA